jgi:hypothetical protein
MKQEQEQGQEQGQEQEKQPVWIWGALMIGTSISITGMGLVLRSSGNSIECSLEPCNKEKTFANNITQDPKQQAIAYALEGSTYWSEQPDDKKKAEKEFLNQTFKALGADKKPIASVSTTPKADGAATFHICWLNQHLTRISVGAVPRKEQEKREVNYNPRLNTSTTYNNFICNVFNKPDVETDILDIKLDARSKLPNWSNQVVAMHTNSR